MTHCMKQQSSNCIAHQVATLGWLRHQAGIHEHITHTLAPFDIKSQVSMFLLRWEVKMRYVNMNFLCGNWNKVYISVPINPVEIFPSRDFVGTQSVYKVPVVRRCLRNR